MGMRHNGSVTWPASSMTTRSARSKPSQKCRRLLPLGQRAMALAWTRRALSAPARQVGSVERGQCCRRPAAYQRGTVGCRQCAWKRLCHQPMWRASPARPWSCVCTRNGAPKSRRLHALWWLVEGRVRPPLSVARRPFAPRAQGESKDGQIDPMSLGPAGCFEGAVGAQKA